MNILGFNKVIYKGNINKDFYFYCLKKDIKLIKFLFLNIWYYVLSLLFYSKRDVYEVRKFRYLKYVKNLKILVKDFYNKERLNSYLDIDKDIVIDRVPVVLIKHVLSDSKIVGYELDSNFDVKLEEFNIKVSKYNKARNLYLRSQYIYKDIVSERLFVVNNNKIRYINKRKKLNYKIINLLVILILSIILTCISFLYTNYLLDFTMIFSYFSPMLFFINFFPIFLIMLLLFFFSKRIHISFIISYILVLALGIANQTKILYRDDIVKFEDFLLLKEAATMTARYDIVIRWYSILTIVFIVVMFIFLKKYTRKLKILLWKRVLAIIFLLFVFFGSYKLLYSNDRLYSSLGKKGLVNQWIETRQYQLRGLIYPFVYTFSDGFVKEPEGYDEKRAIEILDDYEYQEIEDDKKVSVIAIMLEAYNDFSKFDTIEFNEDIYEKFHKIQDNSISGNLVTSIFGGGTIETERNFLTGYYKFPTFRGVTNSHVWYFKEQGYRTEAMHPIYGAFYNRASVNINLGFDDYYYYENKFSSVHSEFMDDYEFFDYIIEGYENSRDDDVPYFNFSVTYQNHGPYDGTYYVGKEYYFEDNGYDNVAYNTINQYFSGIKKTNEALDKLITYFDKEKEPVIVILFGDHNPYLGENAIGYSEFGIDLSLDSLDGFLNYYQTPYIIHANNSAKEVFNKSFVGEGNDISPMFLMNELFDYCELEGNKYLQYMSDLKKDVDVINPYYNKEDGKYVLVDKSNYMDEILEYSWVNYYYANYR